MKLEKRVEGFSAHRTSGAEPATDDLPTIDLRSLVTKLWRGKWILIVSVFLFGLAGYLAVSQITPIYQATAKVMFDLTRRNIVDVEQLVIPAAVSENTLQNQIEVLKSTSLIERVVRLERLDSDPEFNPRLREAKPTIVDSLRSFISLPPSILDTLQALGIVAPPAPQGPPPDPEEIAALERRLVITNVQARLGLRPVEGSKVIDLSFYSENPETAARVANRMAEQYIVDQLEAKLEATRAATDWLTTRVEELRLKVQGAENAVEQARAELSLEAGQSLEITQQQLQSLNATLSVTRNAATSAQSTFERLEAAVRENRDFGAIPEFRESELIRAFRSRSVDLTSKRAALVGTVPATHPALLQVEAQLVEVDANIKLEAARVVEAARSQWVAQQAQREQLEAEVRLLETKGLEQSREQVALRQLEREAQANRVLYENFLARLTETSQQEELQTADARILSVAERPFTPLSQARQRMLLAALFLGLLFGLMVIFILDKLNNTFRAVQQLEAVSGETVLGTIPAVGRRVRRRDVLKNFKEKPKSSLAEAVRSLRTSILFSNVDSPPQVVMFTSSIPREGKSTTSMLVAMTSRQMGKSAIIVDCDLRLPALARLLNADDKEPGLLSVIAGNVTLEQAIFRDPMTGLHVLMTKSSEPRTSLSAADVLSSKRFLELIQQLKASYDLVILDTPPALIVADARILSSLADAVVYVVRWDHTPRGAVMEGLKELRAVRAPVAGVVLSLMNEARASKYNYDGYSYYRGKHKDYYIS